MYIAVLILDRQNTICKDCNNLYFALHKVKLPLTVKLYCSFQLCGRCKMMMKHKKLGKKKST